jgi:hypothetical protein
MWVIASHLLTRTETYRDWGATSFDALERQGVERRLVRRLERLGYQVELTPAPQIACATCSEEFVSYSRFVELMPGVLLLVVAYLQTQMWTCTGISFLDSTSLAVCHTAGIQQHRVFAVDAARGKTSVGWFCGFKLHLAVNDRGELLAFCLTHGTIDDRQPVPDLLTSVQGLFGTLFADKG